MKVNEFKLIVALVVLSICRVFGDDTPDTGRIIVMDEPTASPSADAVIVPDEGVDAKKTLTVTAQEPEHKVVIAEEGSVQDAIHAVFAQMPEFIVSYDLLTEEEKKLLNETDNKFSTSGKKLAWERAAKQILSQINLNYFQDKEIIKVGSKEVVDTLYSAMEGNKLSFNHTRIVVDFSGGFGIHDALCTIRSLAGVNMNFDYMKPEHRGIRLNTPETSATEGEVVVAAQQPSGHMTTYSVPEGQKIEWRLVMKEVLDPIGYMFIEDNGTVKPMPKDAYAKYMQDKINAKPLVIRMRRINHADAETLVEKIKLMEIFKHEKAYIDLTFAKDEKAKLFQSSSGNNIQTGSSGDKIGANTSGSSFNRLERPVSVVGVIYADIEENLDLIEERIAMLDVHERQVLIEALVLDISDGMKHELGVKWNDLSLQYNSQAPFNEPQSFYQFDDDGNIEMDDLTVTTTAADGTTSDTTFEVPDLVQRMITGSDMVNLQDWAGDVARNRFGVSPISFDAVIKMIDGDQHSRMLGNPVITVGDHGEALIQITKITPVEQTSIQNNNYGGGGQTIAETEWMSLQTGYTLWVSPEISEDGKQVRLSVHPQITEIGDTVYASRKEWQSSEDLDDREKNYEVTSQELDTRVIVPSGQALLMGGLTRSRTMDTVSKVPLLGDIPLLGRLFRYDASEKMQSHLVLIIRPTVLDEENPRTGFEGKSMKIINEMSKGTGKTLDPEMGINRYKNKEKKTIDKIKDYFSGDDEEEGDEGEAELPPVETAPIESVDLTKMEKDQTE